MSFTKAWGIEHGLRLSTFRGRFPFCNTENKAQSLWQWSNYMHRQVESDRRVLLINFDETNVRLHQESVQGNLTVRAQRIKRRALPLTHDVPRSYTRAPMTLAAAVCGDPSKQELLTQVVLLSKRLLAKAVFDAL